MPDNNFQPADKILWHDKVLAGSVLRLIPRWIYPNHITVFRFLATPIVVVLMLFEHYYIGLIAFLLVAFTDAMDGSMARTRNQITDWGKIYDPLADKVLIGSMVFIIVLRYIDFWTSIVIIGLEIAIITTAWIRKIKGYKVEANIWGKIKMMLQVAGVAILLLSIIFNLAALVPYASGALYIAIAFAIVSLLSYGI
jgi:CDP-diacylglycerol--glycerol-3-phosphate 3-phosphatidyltransferase